jgi:hypothetical protein
MFGPLEEYVGPSILIVGPLCFFVLLGCMLKLSLQFVYFTFAEFGVSTVI